MSEEYVFLEDFIQAIKDSNTKRIFIYIDLKYEGEIVVGTLYLTSYSGETYFTHVEELFKESFVIVAGEAVVKLKTVVTGTDQVKTTDIPLEQLLNSKRSELSMRLKEATTSVIQKDGITKVI